jgi:hypothetical protein
MGVIVVGINELSSRFLFHRSNILCVCELFDLPASFTLLGY